MVIIKEVNDYYNDELKLRIILRIGLYSFFF